MFTKYRYATLGTISVVASGILVASSLLILYYIGQLQKMISGFDFDGVSSVNGLSMGLNLFVFGLAAVLVAAIYQILYYIFAEKQKAILFSGIASIISFMVYLFAISNVFSSLGNLFSKKPTLSSGTMWFALLIAVLVFLFNLAIKLQMSHKLFLPFLAGMMPTQTIGSAPVQPTVETLVGETKEETPAETVEAVKEETPAETVEEIKKEVPVETVEAVKEEAPVETVKTVKEEAPEETPVSNDEKKEGE